MKWTLSGVVNVFRVCVFVFVLCTFWRVIHKRPQTLTVSEMVCVRVMTKSEREREKKSRAERKRKRAMLFICELSMNFCSVDFNVCMHEEWTQTTVIFVVAVHSFVFYSSVRCLLWFSLALCRQCYSKRVAFFLVNSQNSLAIAQCAVQNNAKIHPKTVPPINTSIFHFMQIIILQLHHLNCMPNTHLHQIDHEWNEMKQNPWVFKWISLETFGFECQFFYSHFL